MTSLFPSFSLSSSMAGHSRSTSSPHCIERFCKACTSFVSDCYDDKDLHLKKADHKDRHSNTNEVDMNEVHNLRFGRDGYHGRLFKRRSFDKPFTCNALLSPISRSTSPSCLSGALSKKSQSTTVAASVSNSTRHGESADSASLQRMLSGSGSRMGPAPIMFSNSSGLLKPPPMEKAVECTLEELCFGCIKKIKITRDAVTNNRQIIQEDEVLTIKVKPGWTKGTKITFEGMGNEIPGASPADVVFEIAERRHPVYTREGDDLELAVEIPLVQALTGCSVSIPLLGGGKEDLEIGGVIYPGYEKLVSGQGMPKKDHRERGNLNVVFLVAFPEELTQEQRYQVVTILEDSDYSSS